MSWRSGHPEAAEPALRSAILEEELQARGAGAENVVYARENRELYAVLAAVWLAEKRPAIDILALWSGTGCAFSVKLCRLVRPVIWIA